MNIELAAALIMLESYFHWLLINLIKLIIYAYYKHDMLKKG